MLFCLQKVGSPRRGRRSNVLKVALTFPNKKAVKKRPASEPLPQPNVHNSEEEEEESFMVKRALNIKENKEMVQLFSCSRFINSGQSCRNLSSSSSVHSLVCIYSLQSSWRN